jgi:class 3 adenylate cyclase
VSEERKLVTVIFADIVGSTELGEHYDPEVIRATLGHAFAELSEILRAHGGTVEKFIGDAVMAVFGGPERA